MPILDGSSEAATHTIQLPRYLAIGFTGHRELENKELLKDGVSALLKRKLEECSGHLYGVSSAAAGGDLLFANTCRELQIPLKILLPMPLSDFRNDFTEVEWEQVERVLDYAFLVEVTGDQTDRPERYYDCGIETAKQCALLVAFWNGKESRGLGGTADIVDFARQTGREIAWFHADTGVLTISGVSDGLAADEELEFLNDLEDQGVTLRSESPSALADAWLAKMDANASQLAPHVRRLASFPLICTAAAALLTSIASHLHTGRSWLVAGSTLGVASIYLPDLLKIKSHQKNWARVRLAAEVSRSVLSLWHAPARFEVVSAEMFPELSGMLGSLNTLKARGSAGIERSFETFKEQYIRERVQDQIVYFTRHAARAKREAKVYKRIAKTAATIGTAASFALLLLDPLLQRYHLARVDYFALATTVFFQLATVFGFLRAINDSDRRARRYKEVISLLNEWEKTLTSLKTWAPTVTVAAQVERALLSELLEWRTVMRNKKLV